MRTPSVAVEVEGSRRRPRGSRGARTSSSRVHGAGAAQRPVRVVCVSIAMPVRPRDRRRGRGSVAVWCGIASASAPAASLAACVTSYSLARCALPALIRDAWISFRTNEFGKDEELAIQLYTMLTAKSWRVFYAPICLPGTCCLGGRFFSCLRHFPLSGRAR